MKKILSLSILMLFIGSLAFAQTATHRFNVNLTSPANNSTIANGSNIAQSFIITLSLGNIVPGDTVVYSDPFVPNGQVWIARTGISKSQGDTIIVNKPYNGVSATPGTSNYCIRAAVLNRSAPNYVFDTVGNTSCNSVTITGFPASVKNMHLTENVQTQKVSIYPNPAIGDIVNLDFAAQNSSEVVVNVFDLTGRKVLTHSYGKAFKGQEGYNLDISSINKGLYILELRQDGIKATGQFVK